MGKTKKTSLANDLLDEILLDEESSEESLGENFEFGSVSQTLPVAAADEKTNALDEDDDEGTVPISSFESQTPSPSFSSNEESSNSEHKVEEAPSRAAVGRAEAFRSSGAMGASEAALAQSENLRLAQDRILELEKEIERLRIENEELGAAGETLRRRSDELLSLNEELERKLEHEVSTLNQEKEILRNSRDLLRKEVEELKQKNTELELRISTNIQRVRVRERELENRLELVRVESKALVRSKDEMILDLKRQIDQLNLELNNYRVKSQDLNKQIAERQETLRRTVKALRLALSMMEGEEQPPLKKAK